MLKRGGSLALIGFIVAVAPVPAHARTRTAAFVDAAALPVAFASKPKVKDGVTPEQAAGKRATVQAEGRRLRSEGNPAQAGVVYDRGAAEQGDPVLYLDAGDAYLEAAKKDADIEMAEAAVERSAIAQDILYFHLDSGADKNFRLVDAGDVPGLLRRADDLRDAALAAIAEIDKGDDPTVSAATAPEPKRKGDGKIKIVAGVALASVGGGLVVMGVAGLAIGAVNQSRADDPAIYGGAYDDVERKGKLGNVLAGVGLGVGLAAVTAGVVLYMLGRRDKKRAAQGDKVVMVSPTFGGMALTGRF